MDTTEGNGGSQSAQPQSSLEVKAETIAIQQATADAVSSVSEVFIFIYFSFLILLCNGPKVHYQSKDLGLPEKCHYYARNYALRNCA